MGKPIRDLQGQIFKRLTVTERVEKPITSTQTGAWWLCKCDCGHILPVSGRALTSGTTKSCGCYKLDVRRETMKKIQHEKHGSIYDRFINRYAINENNGCWEWLAHRDKDGYGILPTNGKAIRAHRFSFKHYKGIDPGNLMVCHSCDNPGCVNPDHLFLGTCKENIRDCLKKERDAMVGSRNNKAKLTEHSVLSIRSDKRHNLKIAQEYGVSISTIKRIKNRSLWKHIS